MRILNILIIFCLIPGFGALPVLAGDITGYAAAEGMFFLKKAQISDQSHNDASVAFNIEYYSEFENGSNFTFTPSSVSMLLIQREVIMISGS